MISRLVCLFKGHKRGKRIGVAVATTPVILQKFQCPRCGAQWTRKAK